MNSLNYPTQLKMSSAYHLQTNGQTEVVNRYVKQYLCCLVHQQPQKWYSLLPWAEFQYNMTYHVSTGMSPFQALYGCPFPMIPHYQLGSSPVNEVDQNLASHNDLLNQLKLNLHQASNWMKQIADSKRRDIEFNEGNFVFLKLHPYRRQTVLKRASQKLAHRFYRPFPIEKRIGKVAYQLQLPAGSRINPVFHVSLLKKKIGDSSASYPTLPPLTDDGTLIIELAEIIDTRWLKKGGKFFEECLVKMLLGRMQQSCKIGSMT